MNRIVAKLDTLASMAIRSRTLRLRNTRPMISFTFDDFPHSAVANGARLLESAGVLGTFYLASQFCDATVDGIAYYTLGDVRRLLECGHEVGCHTATHARVPGLSRKAFNDELDRNQAFVAEHFGDIQLRSFAYPFGAVSPRAKMTAEKRFASCRGIVPEINGGSVDLGLVRAVKLYEHLYDREKLRGLLGKLRVNSWLVFFTHDVDSSPSVYGVSPSLLGYAIETALEMGHEILTMKSALGRAAFAA